MVSVKDVNEHHGIDPFAVFAGAVAFLVASTWVTCFNETGARTFWGKDVNGWGLKKVIWASVIVSLIAIMIYVISYSVDKRSKYLK